MKTSNKVQGGAMKQFFVSIYFSFVIATANVVALDAVQAREPVKATNRLTTPLDTIESSAPDTPQAIEHRKRLLIKLLRERPLVPAEGYDTPFCREFLQDFTKQTNIEHVQPVVVNDYHDPVLRKYLDRCPNLELADKYNLGWLLGTPRFSLYRLPASPQIKYVRARNDDTVKGRETYVFGQELFWKKEVAGQEYIKGEAIYKVVDLNACRTIGPDIDAAMVEASYPLGTELKNLSPGRSLRGVIRHRDKTTIYKLTENPEYPWWLTLYVLDGDQPDLCNYNTKEFTDRYPKH